VTGSGGGSRKSGLGKGQAEFEGGSSEGNTAVQGSWITNWINSGGEHEVVHIGRASEEISGDWGKNGVPMVIAEAKTNKVVNKEEECGANKRADELGFYGSIVGTARNVGEGCDQFG
jgi:hypothetical protein